MTKTVKNIIFCLFIVWSFFYFKVSTDLNITKREIYFLGLGYEWCDNISYRIKNCLLNCGNRDAVSQCSMPFINIDAPFSGGLLPLILYYNIKNNTKNLERNSKFNYAKTHFSSANLINFDENIVYKEYLISKGEELFFANKDVIFYSKFIIDIVIWSLCIIFIWKLGKLFNNRYQKFLDKLDVDKNILCLITCCFFMTSTPILSQIGAISAINISILLILLILYSGFSILDYSNEEKTKIKKIHFYNLSFSCITLYFFAGIMPVAMVILILSFYDGLSDIIDRKVLKDFFSYAFFYKLFRQKDNKDKKLQNVLSNREVIYLVISSFFLLWGAYGFSLTPIGDFFPSKQIATNDLLSSNHLIDPTFLENTKNFLEKIKIPFSEIWFQLLRYISLLEFEERDLCFFNKMTSPFSCEKTGVWAFFLIRDINLFFLPFIIAGFILIIKNLLKNYDDRYLRLLVISLSINSLFFILLFGYLYRHGEQLDFLVIRSTLSLILCHIGAIGLLKSIKLLKYLMRRSLRIKLFKRFSLSCNYVISIPLMFFLSFSIILPLYITYPQYIYGLWPINKLSIYQDSEDDGRYVNYLLSLINNDRKKYDIRKNHNIILLHNNYFLKNFNSLKKNSFLLRDVDVNRDIDHDILYLKNLNISNKNELNDIYVYAHHRLIIRNHLPDIVRNLKWEKLNMPMYYFVKINNTESIVNCLVEY